MYLDSLCFSGGLNINHTYPIGLLQQVRQVLLDAEDIQFPLETILLNDKIPRFAYYISCFE